MDNIAAAGAVCGVFFFLRFTRNHNFDLNYGAHYIPIVSYSLSIEDLYSGRLIYKVTLLIAWQNVMKRDGYFEQKTEITKQPIEKMKLEDTERERKKKLVMQIGISFLMIII